MGCCPCRKARRVSGGTHGSYFEGMELERNSSSENGPIKEQGIMGNFWIEGRPKIPIRSIYFPTYIGEKHAIPHKSWMNGLIQSLRERLGECCIPLELEQGFRMKLYVCSHWVTRVAVFVLKLIEHVALTRHMGGCNQTIKCWSAGGNHLV